MSHMPRSSFLISWHFSGVHKTYPPSKGFKAACVKRSPCSILKKSRETLQSGTTPKKRVRFSLPGEGNLKLDDDNSLNFKGFTTEDLRQMDKLQISIEKIKRLEETLTLRQKVAVTEAVRRNNGIIPFRMGRGQNRKAYFLCQKKFERCISKTGQMVKTGNISLESRKMQCRICCRIAYLPASQQAEVGGSNLYFCNVSLILKRYWKLNLIFCK